MKPTVSLSALRVLVRYPDDRFSLDDLLSFTRNQADRLALFSYALHLPDSPINNNVSEHALAGPHEHAQTVSS